MIYIWLYIQKIGVRVTKSNPAVRGLNFKKMRMLIGFQIQFPTKILNVIFWFQIECLRIFPIPTTEKKLDTNLND